MLIRRLFPHVDSLVQRNLSYDLLSAALYGLFAGAVVPFLSVIGIRIGATNVALGLITAAPCGALLASFYWGIATQDKPKVPYVMWANTVGRGLLMLMALTTSAWPYVGIVLLFWLVVSIPSAPYAALMEKIYPAEYRGRLLAYVRVSIGILQLITVSVAGRLLDVWGYRVIFPIAAVFGALSGVTFGWIKEPEPGSTASASPTGSAWTLSNSGNAGASGTTASAASARRKRPNMALQLKSLMQDRSFMLWEAGFMLFGVGNLFLVPVYALFQVNYLGLSNAQVGFYQTVWTAAWLLAYPFWGSFIDRKGPGRAIIISVLLFGGCALSYYLGRSYALVLVAAALNGIAEAAIDIGWMNQCIALAPGRVSVYSGMHSTLLGVRGVVGPILGATLVPVIGLLPSLFIGAVTVLFGVVPMFVAYRSETARTGASTA